MGPDLETSALIASKTTQPFEAARLRLAERVWCQLVGADDLRIPMDPPEFMLAPRSMTNAEYDLWRRGIPFTERIVIGIGLRGVQRYSPHALPCY